MSVTNFILWAQLQKALCLLMLLSKTISTLIFLSVNSAEERKKQVRITKSNSFIPGPCLRNKGRGLGPCLYFVSNVAPDTMSQFGEGQTGRTLSYLKRTGLLDLFRASVVWMKPAHVRESNLLSQFKCSSWKVVVESRRRDSWPLEEKNSIRGQRRGLIALSFCVIKFY